MRFKKILPVILAVLILFKLSFSANATNVLEFQDVPKTHWAYSAIMDMVNRGMFQGTSQAVNGVGTFSPNVVMSRGEFVAVLTRLLYPDQLATHPASGGAWYAVNYAVALEQGLLTPSELDGGQLAKNCTRQEMAMLLVRAAKAYNEETPYELIPVSRIADYDAVSSYYQGYVLQAYSMGLLTGIDNIGTYDPNGVLKRDQGATVIYRLIEPTTRNVVRFNEICEFTWDSGIKYVGEYRDGEADGYGVMTFPDIGSYQGYFSGGKRNGIGTFSWNVGDRYVGNWADDAMSGAGTYTFSDGYTIRGDWNNNRIVSSSMEMSKSSVTLTEGAWTELVAVCEPAQVTDTVSWVSSDSSVVTVSGRSNVCRIAAQKAGSAVVTARTLSGKTCTCSVTVLAATKSVVQISLNYGDYHLEPGSSVSLKATVTPASSGVAVKWTSSDSSVARINESGTVTAVSKGTAIISATAENGLTATCYIVVDSSFSNMWDGTWTVYCADASGNRGPSGSNGTCRIDAGAMTVRLSAYPYSNSSISLSKGSNYLLSCVYETSLYTYELTFTSIDEDQIILEENRVYRSNTSGETVTTEYYVLFR